MGSEMCIRDRIRLYQHRIWVKLLLKNLTIYQVVKNMSSKFNIAIAGATGNVGREIIQILEDTEFPVDQLHLLASSRSKGQAIEFRGEELIVEDLAEFDFSKVQIGLFSPGGKVSAEFAPKAAKAGCLVIDNTSHFRMHDNAVSYTHLTLPTKRIV